MKKYESEHGVGRSAFGRSSARRVFRNTTHYSNPEPTGNKSFAVNFTMVDDLVLRRPFRDHCKRKKTNFIRRNIGNVKW